MSTYFFVFLSIWLYIFYYALPFLVLFFLLASIFKSIGEQNLKIVYVKHYYLHSFIIYLISFFLAVVFKIMSQKYFFSNVHFDLLFSCILSAIIIIPFSRIIRIKISKNSNWFTYADIIFSLTIIVIIFLFY